MTWTFAWIIYIELFQLVVMFVAIHDNPKLKGPINNTHLLNLLPRFKINASYLHLHTPEVFLRHCLTLLRIKLHAHRCHTKVAVPISVQISDVPNWDAEFFFKKNFERSAKLVQEQL